MGYLTNKMPKDRKQKVVVAFDIAVILVFIWWAFNERASYIQGYTDTLNMVCGKYVIDFCPTWEKMKNMSLGDISKYESNFTMIYPKNLTYCDTENISSCV
jgi:hypothetical protein